MFVFGYGWNGDRLAAPVQIPIGEGHRVVDLVGSDGDPWIASRALCSSCGEFFTAMVQQDSMPHRLQCPRCARNSAVPQAHWLISYAVFCEHCGRETKMVYVDAAKAPDQIPASAKCARCGWITTAPVR